MSRLVIGISFPRDLIEKIDRERGLVSRSKWVVHALEKKYTSDDRGAESNK